MRRFIPSCLLSLLLMIFVLDAQAQQALYEKGQAAYGSADFDAAVGAFAEVARDTSAPPELRREALKYLSRIYVAKDEHEEAREAVTDLLELEPPLVQLDPDVEPPPLLELYYDVRKEFEGGYAVEKPDPGLRTLAIMDFTNNSIDEHERFDPMTQGFASMMINYLGGATDLKVVERERIQWLLQELQLQRSDLVDQSTAVRTGKVLGAHAVLFGSYTVHKKQMHLSARLVKVETGEILFAEQVRGKRDDFFELAEQLSLKVAQSISSQLNAATLGARTETRSLDAQIAYSEGLGELDRGNYATAYQKFQHALELDPEFERAQNRVESLRPMLTFASAGNAPSSGGMP